MSVSPNISTPSVQDGDITNSKLVFPPCWDDDKRMDALFSPFRPQSVNPENYVSKLQFWKDMITNYCFANGSSEIDIIELKNAFKRKGKYPHCLANVLKEMKSTNEIEIKEKFMEETQHSWSGWAVDLVKKQIKWGLTKVKESIVDINEANISYIVTAVVKKQSEEVLAKMEAFADSLIMFDEVLNKMNGTNISVDGLKLCIHLLNCQQKVFVQYVNIITENKKMILKFCGKDFKVTPITDLDLAIRGLEETEKELLKVCDTIEESKKEAENEARRCLRDGKKQLAKTFLKKKHTYEKSLEKRLTALENIQIMLSRIQDTKHDAHIVQTYKLGTKTLQAALAESGITVDDVSETLEDVKELLALHEEAQAVVAGTQFNKSYSDKDLELELEALLNDDIPLLPECPNTPVTNNDKVLENRLKQLNISLMAT